MGVNAGDLARTVTHDADERWPSMIEIVAYWSYGGGRRGRRRSIRISANEFFGRGDYGAPMSGDQLINMINQLRLQKAGTVQRRGKLT